MYCKNCGALLVADAKFCPKCGAGVTNDATPTSEIKLSKKSTLAGILSVVVFLLAILLGRYLTADVVTSTNTANSSSSSYSSSDLATQAVAYVKSTTTFPNKLDDVTTWVDITAQQNTIQYHYRLAGVDVGSLSNSYLKSYLLSSVCQTQATKNLLDQGVNLEYHYVVENSAVSYFVLFTKSDCS